MNAAATDPAEVRVTAFPAAERLPRGRVGPKVTHEFC